MLRNLVFVLSFLTMAVGLSACVPPPPRERVVYHEGAAPPPPPSDSYSGSGRYCHSCGTVRVIDQVQIRQGNSGGGAVLGAIIGGVIGNQFGRGGGRAAATAGGAGGGAGVGQSGAGDKARAASGDAWGFRGELDDGRWATVTQMENPGFHSGDRVAIRGGDHLEWLR